MQYGEVAVFVAEPELAKQAQTTPEGWPWKGEESSDESCAPLQLETVQCLFKLLLENNDRL